MEFSFFNSPTLVNYERFISVLDKMISDNINKDFFIGKVEEYEMVTISEGVVERRVKGTLKLMEEWLRKHYTLQDEKGYDKLMKPLKDVRKERQSPAHKITKNHYDKNLYNKQMELLEQVYISFMNLRHIFHQHPRAAFVQIPDWIVESRIKNF